MAVSYVVWRLCGSQSRGFTGRVYVAPTPPRSSGREPHAHGKLDVSSPLGFAQLPPRSVDWLSLVSLPPRFCRPTRCRLKVPCVSTADKLLHRHTAAFDAGKG